MDIVIFLMICLIDPGAVDEECAVYRLSPQWEMTQEVVDRKIEFICDSAESIAVAHGSRLTKCEVLKDKTSEEVAWTTSL